MLNIKNSVLVVVDDRDKAQIISRLLHDIGYRELFIALKMEQAQELVLENKPDIIILGIDLIQMDGLSFLSWIINTRYIGGVCLYTNCEERLLRSIRSMAERSLSYLGDICDNDLNIVRLAIVLGARFSDGKAKPPKVESPCESTLLAAIESKSFCLYAHPKIAVGSLNCVGVELLARWEKDSKILSPLHFVPALQKYPDILIEFDKMIVSMGAEAAAKLHSEFPNMHVALNTTTPSYNVPDFTEHLMMQIYMSGLDINRFILELTESHPLKDNGLECLIRLAMNGISLSIDDFGTHFSNFDKLYTAPFSEIKIDRFVVQRATHDNVAQSILSNSISIAREMDINVTVEGVEDREQLNIISELGADYIQGFLFAKPMPIDKLMQWQENQIMEWGKPIDN